MITNILFLLAGIIGLTVVVIILNHQKQNKIMNPYFVMFLGLSSLRHLFLGIKYFVTEHNFGDIYYKHSNYLILALPLLYLYFKNLETPQKEVNIKELLSATIFPFTFFLLVANKDEFQDLINPINFDLLLFLISFLYSLWYNYLSYQILSKKNWFGNDINVTRKTNNSIRNWTKFLYLAISLIPLKILLTFLFEFSDKAIQNSNIHYFTSIFLLIIVFKALNNPEILYGYEVLNERMKLEHRFNIQLSKNWRKHNENIAVNYNHKILYSKIKSNIPEYIKEIEKISITEELFLKPDININYISNILNIPKSHLQFVFKYYSKLSFIDYKKRIRIYHATKLIEQHYLKHNTLSALSKKVGFSSYDPFYRSFKEIIGSGPLEYYTILQQ